MLFKATFLKDSPMFLRLLAEDACLSLAFSGLKSTINYVVSSVGLSWQEMMYDKIHKLYFNKMLYYKLSFVDQRVDNPEQVIVTDLLTVCTELSEITMIVIGAVVDGSYFTWRLAQMTSPAWAFLPIGYIGVAIAATQKVSPNFGKLYSDKAVSEGALRHAFAHFAGNTEAIAALQGDDRELEIVQSHLDTTLGHNKKLIYTQWWYANPAPNRLRAAPNRLAMGASGRTRRRVPHPCCCAAAAKLRDAAGVSACSETRALENCVIAMVRRAALKVRDDRRLYRQVRHQEPFNNQRAAVNSISFGYLHVRHVGPRYVKVSQRNQFRKPPHTLV